MVKNIIFKDESGVAHLLVILLIVSFIGGVIFSMVYVNSLVIRNCTNITLESKEASAACKSPVCKNFNVGKCTRVAIEGSHQCYEPSKGCQEFNCCDEGYIWTRSDKKCCLTSRKYSLSAQDPVFGSFTDTACCLVDLIVIDGVVTCPSP